MHLPSLLPALRRPDGIHRFDCSLLLVTSLMCITLLIGGLSTGAADGVWTAQGESANYWSVADGRLRWERTDRTESPDAIQAISPLDEDGWTLEVIAAGLDQHGGTNVRWGVRLGVEHDEAEGEQWQGWLEVVIERRSTDRVVSVRLETPADPPMLQRRVDRDQVYMRNCTSPAALLQLSWRPGMPLAILINGRRVDTRLPDVPPPSSPVSIIAAGAGILEVTKATIEPWRDLALDGHPGLAYDGWSGEVEGAALAAERRLITLFDWLASMDSERPHVRSHALAAWYVYEFATAGEVSPELRERAEAHLEATVVDEPAAASRLLPIMVACEPTARREAAWQWTDRLMNTFAEWMGAGLGMEDRYRATLLDPARACLVGSPLSLPLRWSEALIDEIAGGPQAVALLSLASRNDHEGHVWLLPQYLAAHPDLGALMVDWMEDWGRREHFHVDEPDRTLSMAAWRLAPVLPERAVPLVDLIENPEVAADTLMAVAQALPEGDLIASTAEQALVQVVENWQPRTPRSTIVQPMARLARFYAAHDRTEEARAVALQAVARVDDQPQAKAMAARVVASLTRDLQMDDADGLFDLAIEAAIAHDAGYSGPESGTIVWRSATSLLVRDLVGRGQIDRALEITRRLSPDRIPENVAICLSSIIYATVDEDPAQALELLQEVPPVRQRGSLVRNLLPRIARVDFEAALELLDEMPENVRPLHRWRILAISGRERDEETIEARNLAIAQSIESSGARADLWRSRGALLRELDTACPAEVVALESVLATHPEYFARLLLEVTIRSAGLGDDPIWERFVESEEGAHGRIPWGARFIRDWERAAEETEGR